MLCFLPFPMVFPHVSPSVSTISSGVSTVSAQCSPVSYFRFYDYILSKDGKMAKSLDEYLNVVKNLDFLECQAKDIFL